MRFLIILLFVFTFPLSAKITADFQLNNVPISKVVEFYFTEVEKKSYTISPDVTADTRLVSVGFDRMVDTRASLINFLSSVNVKIKTTAGVDHVYYQKPVEKVIPTIQRTYQPLYRTSAELRDDIGTASDVSIFGTSALIVRGPQDRVLDVMAALPLLDQKVSSVELTGYLYEVTDSTSEGSGVTVLLNLLRSKFSVNFSGSTGANFIQIKTGDFTAIFNLLRTDNRFSIVSNPSLRVRSGSEGRFVVGAQVPTVGSVTYQDGRPVQSIEYRDSGAVFRVRADVLGQTIKIHLNQELSEFSQTKTGVDQTPTLSTRSIESVITAKSGDILILGGLGSRKNDSGKSSIFGLTIGKDEAATRGEIILLFTVRVVE